LCLYGKNKVMHLIQPKDADSENQKQYLEGICKMMELSTVIENSNAEYLEMGKKLNKRAGVSMFVCVCVCVCCGRGAQI